jgi:hypothetical protein
MKKCDCGGDLNMGYRHQIDFDNGFGLSIICHIGSYGNKSNLFEAALLKNGELVYCEKYRDVRGFLDFHAVARIIDEVKAYKSDLVVCDSPYGC